MKYVVGDFLDPKKETDETLADFDAACDRLDERSQETENLVVGLWEAGGDYALLVAINGEIFKAV